MKVARSIEYTASSRTFEAVTRETINSQRFIARNSVGFLLKLACAYGEEVFTYRERPFFPRSILYVLCSFCLSSNGRHEIPVDIIPLNGI